jgi:hypothetical protein
MIKNRKVFKFFESEGLNNESKQVVQITLLFLKEKCNLYNKFEQLLGQLSHSLPHFIIFCAK